MCYYSGLVSNDFFQFPSIPYVHILQTIKGLGPSQSGALYGVPAFIIKGCSTIFSPLLKYIIDLSFSKEHFRIQWKKNGCCAYLERRQQFFRQ